MAAHQAHNLIVRVRISLPLLIFNLNSKLLDDQYSNLAIKIDQNSLKINQLNEIVDILINEISLLKKCDKNSLLQEILDTVNKSFDVQGSCVTTYYNFV